VLLWPLYGIASSPIFLGIVVAGLALIDSIAAILISSYRLAMVPDELQGRVGSVYRLIVFGSLALGQVVVGQCLDRFGILMTVGILWSGLILFAFLILANSQLRHASSFQVSAGRARFRAMIRPVGRNMQGERKLTSTYRIWSSAEGGNMTPLPCSLIIKDELRRQPRQVTRECRCQADIGHTGKLHQQSFQADSEAAVGWHTVAEGLQVELEGLDGQMRFL